MNLILMMLNELSSIPTNPKAYRVQTSDLKNKSYLWDIVENLDGCDFTGTIQLGALVSTK